MKTFQENWAEQCAFVIPVGWTELKCVPQDHDTVVSLGRRFAGVRGYFGWRDYADTFNTPKDIVRIMMPATHCYRFFMRQPEEKAS